MGRITTIGSSCHQLTVWLWVYVSWRDQEVIYGVYGIRNSPPCSMKTRIFLQVLITSQSPTNMYQLPHKLTSQVGLLLDCRAVRVAWCRGWRLGLCESICTSQKTISLAQQMALIRLGSPLKHICRRSKARKASLILVFRMIIYCLNG